MLWRFQFGGSPVGVTMTAQRALAVAFEGGGSVDRSVPKVVGGDMWSGVVVIDRLVDKRGRWRAVSRVGRAGGWRTTMLRIMVP